MTGFVTILSLHILLAWRFFPVSPLFVLSVGDRMFCFYVNIDIAKVVVYILICLNNALLA